MADKHFSQLEREDAARALPSAEKIATLLGIFPEERLKSAVIQVNGEERTTVIMPNAVYRKIGNDEPTKEPYTESMRTRVMLEIANVVGHGEQDRAGGWIRYNVEQLPFGI